MLLRRIIQEVLYLFDPFFRQTVRQKRKGPNDRMGAGEEVNAVLLKANGTKSYYRGK
jgi:hypothetical protein